LVLLTDLLNLFSFASALLSITLPLRIRDDEADDTVSDELELETEEDEELDDDETSSANTGRATVKESAVAIPAARSLFIQLGG
jgi:hypothetical protein